MAAAVLVLNTLSSFTAHVSPNLLAA